MKIWGWPVSLGCDMKGPISFSPMLMVPVGFGGGAVGVGTGVEVGTGVRVGAGGLVAVGAAGAVVGAGAPAVAGAVVGAGAAVAVGAGVFVGRGVAVAAAPQARMKRRNSMAEVSTIALELANLRRGIIIPPYLNEYWSFVLLGRQRWSPVHVSEHARICGAVSS